MPDLTVLMPVYNEASTVGAAVRDVLATDFGVDGTELIVIDDGSTDGSYEAVQSETWDGDVRVLRRDRNAGKGAALRAGLAEARGRYLAVIDADLEYDPGDTAQMLKPLVAGDAEAVFGVRGFTLHSAYSFWYVAANKAINMLTNVLYNTWVADVTCCQKVTHTELLRSLPLRERGFGIEAEITARLLQRGIRILEMPVTYRARSREEGKKLAARDGLVVTRTLLRCRVS